MLLIDWRPVIRLLSRDGRSAAAAAEAARWLHMLIADAAVTMTEFGAAHTASRRVLLSGGVFQNRLLTDLLIDRLETAGFEVWLHRRVPPNDGGIAVGQAFSTALGWHQGSMSL